MNLLDATVTEVHSYPYEQYGKWWVQVEYDCWGHRSTTSLMFDTKEEASAVAVGYVFLC